VQKYSKPLKIAKLECGIYGAIVAICGFVLALGLSLALKRYFHFEFHDDSGVVGWVSVNKYPKQQETFYYLSALMFMPSFTLFCWLFWVGYAAAISRLIRVPVRRILKQDAFTYLPFLLILGRLHQLDLPLKKLFLLPLGLLLGAKITLLLYNLITAILAKKLSKSLTSQPVEDDIPFKELKAHPDATKEQCTRLKREAVWSILASGLCIGFYVLLGYAHDSPTPTRCLTILLVAAFSTLAFSLMYSFIVSRLLNRQFHNIFAGDAYSYIPAVLLLLFAVSYPGGKYLLLVIFLLALLGIKSLYLFNKKFRQFALSITDGATPLFQRLMEYLTIPALIYVLLYGGGNIHGGIDLFHEGERLAPLNELLRGGIPFRDIYIQHGWFQNAFRPLLASALFGDTLAAVRYLERLFGPIGYVSVYLLGLQVFKKRLTAILAMFIASAQNFWVSDRHSLGLISIAFVANYIGKHRDVGLFAGWRRIKPYPNRWLEITECSRIRQNSGLVYGWKLILAGICTNLAFFYSTEIGLYSFAACGLFLLAFGFTQQHTPLKLRPLPVLCYGIGAFLGFLPFAVYFGWHFALDDVIQNSYIQCVYQIPTWGLKFPELMGSLAGLTSLRDAVNFVLSETFRWYLPILFFLIAATYLLYQAAQGGFWSSASNAKLLLLLLAGITFFRTALGRSDGGHLVYGATIMWFISLFFLERAFLRAWCNPSAERYPQSRVSFRIPQAMLVLIPMVIFNWYVSNVHKPVDVAKSRLVSLTQYKSIQRDVPQTLERAGGIQLSEVQVNQIQQVVKYIQSNTTPDEHILDFSSQGAYYFFANRPAATRYHQIAYASTNNTQEEVIQSLERTKTKLVIFKTGGWFDNIDGIASTDRHPIIARYLDENYEEAVNINGAVILKRKSRLIDK